jgi:filamentous hemagglutinin
MTGGGSSGGGSSNAGGLTNQEARKRAQELGFKEVKDAPFSSHGKPVFKKGDVYITPDRDMHKGGVWKMFDRRGNRVGTYNADLSGLVGK